MALCVAIGRRLRDIMVAKIQPHDLVGKQPILRSGQHCPDGQNTSELQEASHAY